MKVKYNEIANANEPLLLLSKKEMSVKEAVGIARIIKALREEYSIYQDKEKELLDKYGEPMEYGRYKFSNEESVKCFNDRYTELLDYEVDLDIERVKLTSEIKIDADTIIAVEKFIDFE